MRAERSLSSLATAYATRATTAATNIKGIATMTLWWTLAVFGALIAIVFFSVARSSLKLIYRTEALVALIIGFAGLGLTIWASYKLNWFDRSAKAITAAIGEQPVQHWQGRVAEWNRTLVNTRDRAKRFRQEKASVLQRLVELGVARSPDISKSVTARTVAEELRDLVVDIELADDISKDLEAGIQEMESYVRRLDRAMLLRGRDAESTSVLRSLDAIEKNLNDIMSRNTSYDSRDVKAIVDQEFLRGVVPAAATQPAKLPAAGTPRTR